MSRYPLPVFASQPSGSHIFQCQFNAAFAFRGFHHGEKIRIAKHFHKGACRFVPADVHVIVNNHSFLGGVGDETVSNQSPDAKCITVNANNFMGGVSIKN